jgi:dTDP-4-dehydrorhamnose 3,5-epimerase
MTLARHEDARGFFSETYSQRALAAVGIADSFVQDNHSMSRQRGTVRGLHFQIPPATQTKLIRVLRGAIFDVAVDLRHGSPTFGRHASCVLTATGWQQLYVPEGFAHGFCSLEERTEVLYKCSAHYAPESERGLRWDDPALGIDWPVTSERAVVSERDRAHPCLAELPAFFTCADPSGGER